MIPGIEPSFLHFWGLDTYFSTITYPNYIESDNFEDSPQLIFSKLTLPVSKMPIYCKCISHDLQDPNTQNLHFEVRFTISKSVFYFSSDSVLHITVLLIYLFGKVL